MSLETTQIALCSLLTRSDQVPYVLTEQTDAIDYNGEHRFTKRKAGTILLFLQLILFSNNSFVPPDFALFVPELAVVDTPCCITRDT